MGAGKLSLPPTRKHSLQSVHEAKTGIGIDRIGIWPQARMLTCVKAGNGIDTRVGEAGEFTGVILKEGEPRHGARQHADVDNLDWHASEQVRHKAVDPRADAEVVGRMAGKDLA